MISSIRRAITSKIGALIALLLLAVVGLSFALADVNQTGGSAATAVGNGNIVSVGRRQISANELRQRFNSLYDQQLRQNPGLTKQAFIASGALERLTREMADVYALEQFARAHGVGIDRASIDGIIARNPAFFGLNGSFDQSVFEQRLGQQGLTAAGIRGDLENGAIVRQIVGPPSGIAAVPMGVALPYASLLLEMRDGQAAFIPAARFMPTTGPTDAQLAAYYASQRARYIIPERRVVRFALLDDSAVRTPPVVTDAEIAAEYRTNAAQYAASQSRRLLQVIAGTRTIADRIADAARNGSSVSAAAGSAGLSTAPVTATSAAQYASGTSSAAATAVFGASQRAVVGPVQVPLGWLVVQVDAIINTPERTLADVTPELREQLTARKRQEAMVDIYNGIQSALTGGASVSEIATDKGLRLITTPALLPNGTAPGNASYRPDPLMASLLSAVFQAHDGDPAQIVTLQENRIFAIVEVARVVPAAPPPLAGIRERAVGDWRLNEGARIARDRARTILAAVEGGQTLSAATTAAGVAGAVQPIGGRRINISNRERGVPPEIALLFSMPQGSAKTLELPANAGWMVIRLDRVRRGDATSEPQLVTAVSQQFTQALGAEYANILVLAARAAFPVTTDEAALARLRAELSGTAAPTS